MEIKEIDKILDDIADYVKLKPDLEFGNRIPSDLAGRQNFGLTLCGYHAYLSDLKSDLEKAYIAADNQAGISLLTKVADKSAYRWQSQYEDEKKNLCLDEYARYKRCKDILDTLETFIGLIRSSISAMKVERQYSGDQV